MSSFLPTIPKLQIPSGGDSHEEPRLVKSHRLSHSTGQLYPTNPKFLARRLTGQDISNEHHDNNSLAVTSRFEMRQIMEEMSENPRTTNNLESPAHEQTFDGIDLSPEPKRSIFKEEKMDGKRYQEYSRGPQYFNGKLVRHSIVGPTDLFERTQRQVNRVSARDLDNSVRTCTSKDSLSNLSFSTKIGKDNSTVPVTRDGSKKSTFAMQAVTMMKKDAKKPGVTRQELIKEIDNLRGRQDKFYKKIEEQVAHMKPEDRLYFTRQSRCLEKFDKFQDDWEQIFEKTSAKVGRAKTDSVVAKAEDYRERKEIADSLEIIKNRVEKFGTTHWYMTLRKGENESRGAFVKDDMPMSFSSTVVDKSATEVEIIRKPRSMKATLSQASQSVSYGMSFNSGAMTDRISDRTSREYFENKISKALPFLSEVRASAEGVDDMIVLLLSHSYLTCIKRFTARIN